MLKNSHFHHGWTLKSPLGSLSIAAAAPRNDLESCLAKAVGGNVDRAQFPTEESFITNDVKHFNLNLKYEPAAVMYPQNKQQVVEVVKCAAKHDKKVQARSGGRDFISKCLGGADGAVVIATVSPGNRLRSLVEGLNKNGKRFIPHGASPTVGVGGHLMVGGSGLATRQHGLAIDMLEQVEVVLADGTITTASEKKHSDLFFAMRGAGASFGIATEFKLRTLPEPKEVVSFQFNFTSDNPADLSESLKAYHQILRDPNLSRKLGATSNISKKTFFLNGGFFGSEAEYKALNLEGRLPEMSSKRVVPGMSYIDFINGIMQAASGFPDSANMYTKDTVVTPSTLPTNATIDAFVNHITTASADGSGWTFLIDLYGGAGNEVATDATAFPHRDLIYSLTAAALTDGPTTKTAEDFIDNAVLKLQDGKPGRFLAYAGVPNYKLNNAQAMYWGPNLARLRKIKSKYDPEDMFSTPQNIKP
ncbi:FAD binding domain-containing [Fusarium albosuccineum]|uniref:FAD binding domain-containing n=1 Tax=Fusarium albosuccineum TaxID=1237068 RepID=A0A8H4PDZ5_9HYPO|nr:FAD binding domain-containing [Fusarium albosuccineum]